MKVKTVAKHHVLEGLTQYLRSLSIIDDNQEVVQIRNFPDTVDVCVEKVSKDTEEK